MNPFNFKIQGDEKKLDRRLILYSCTAVALMAAFTAGFITVYVNTYNIISSEPMEVFGYYQSDDMTGVVLFDHFFRIKG